MQDSDARIKIVVDVEDMVGTLREAAHELGSLSMLLKRVLPYGYRITMVRGCKMVVEQADI